MNVAQLTSKLLSFKSVTPHDDGVIDFIISILEPIGFICEKIQFENVLNLYARYGSKSPNLCFAGHTDVVPAGDENAWTHPPFAEEIIGDKIYGRGAVDMKGAIASFICAVQNLNLKNLKGSISFLITSDEEGEAINGTEKVLQYLKQRGENLDFCIVGEPTNPEFIGQMVKIGRRGSVTFELSIEGKQGHVAYPHLAKNPITQLVGILDILKNKKLDDGTQHFDASNLEVVHLSVNNSADNVIPAYASARFNIRFNDLHTIHSLKSWVVDICKQFGDNYTLTHGRGAESFLSSDLNFAQQVAKINAQITNHDTQLSTTGGTSDARFIHKYCPVVECGLINQTAHKIDEYTAIYDLKTLEEIYSQVIQKFTF